MNAVEKRKLRMEAEMQMRALKKINVWKTIAIALSTIGVALTYAGLAGAKITLFLGIPGIILVLVGIAGAAVLNLGLKNGRRNVEKMLEILDQKAYEV